MIPALLMQIDPFKSFVPSAGTVDPNADRVSAAAAELTRVSEQIASLREQQTELARVAGTVAEPLSQIEVLNGYFGVFVVSFVATLLATPIFRRLAITNGIIDRPNEARKQHKFPIAYLGGLAVFVGIMAGIAFAMSAPLHGLMSFHATQHVTDAQMPRPVPWSILLGLTLITIVGLLDDVYNIAPSTKIAGMLFAAAALAFEDVGVKVAAQVLNPVGNWIGYPGLVFRIPLPGELPLLGSSIPIDLIYWAGTAVIAIFVLGACNATNLIDGLDGLCSGVSAIAAGFILIIALSMAAWDNGPLDSARIILTLALIGGCLGFLPHNYNPASIFLGDCGSLLLGYTLIVLVLTLGDQGQTNLVMAGLVIFAVPIIDTALAIVRRKLSGQKLSAADDQHLHHILKRALGVKGAVTVLYLIGATFGGLGLLLSLSKARFSYAVVLVFAAFVGVIALKAARRKQFEEQAAKALAAEAAAAAAAAGNGATQTPVTSG